MEQIILCTIVSCYAVYVDLTAAVLRGSGDIYQTLPMTVWGVIVSIAAIIDAMVVFRKQIKENADLTRVRYKRANKVAQKRLKAAKKLLAEGNKAAFYEEIERAAVSYLSDRLSIPTADLSKETIADILQTKGVREELIAEVKDVLSTAEFARYAPSADSQMQTLYDRTSELINQLENQKL